MIMLNSARVLHDSRKILQDNRHFGLELNSFIIFTLIFVNLSHSPFSLFILCTIFYAFLSSELQILICRICTLKGNKLTAKFFFNKNPIYFLSIKRLARPFLGQYKNCKEYWSHLIIGCLGERKSSQMEAWFYHGTGKNFIIRSMIFLVDVKLRGSKIYKRFLLKSSQIQKI